MNYPCRCNRCHQRRSLRKPDKLCQCGGVFRVDKYRLLKEDKNPCHCDGYPFPHSRGRSKACRYHPIGFESYEEELEHILRVQKMGRKHNA
jgi:hypothetical protein